jgi:hypothetical protein
MRAHCGTEGSNPSSSSGKSVPLPELLSSVENPGFPRDCAPLVPDDLKGPKLGFEARLSDARLRLACLQEQARLGLKPESSRERAINSPGATYDVLPFGYRDKPSKEPAIEHEIKGLTAAIMHAASGTPPQTPIKERAANPTPLPRGFTSEASGAVSHPTKPEPLP